MIFYILWNYLVGYVVIRVDGVSLEKFINLTVSKGIRLWKINRQNYTTLTACISIKGFKQLHAISQKIHCRIRITEKCGFPFLAYRYRHRKMLITGMLVFLMILYGFSSFIWSVDIEGTETINPQRIIDELATLGIRPGVFKRNIDTLSIENRLIINIHEISWASLEIRGSRAIVKVAESVLPPTVIDKSIPTNVVAKNDGIIQNMIVLEGQAIVVVGQTVQKGQLLISGVIDHPDTTGVRYVHAMGQIMARTWYEGYGTISLKEPYKKQTGRKAEVRYIGISSLKIPYKKDDIIFEHYDLVVRSEGLITIEEYYEVEEIQWDNNIEKAKENLEQIALTNAREKIPNGAKIIDKKLKYDIIEGDRITAVIYIEALEDIGMQQNIIVK